MIRQSLLFLTFALAACVTFRRPPRARPRDCEPRTGPKWAPSSPRRWTAASMFGHRAWDSAGDARRAHPRGRPLRRARFASAGGHWNPTGAKHGTMHGPVTPVTLPNLTVAANGTASLDAHAPAGLVAELLDADGAALWSTQGMTT